MFHAVILAEKWNLSAFMTNRKWLQAIHQLSILSAFGQ